MKLYILVLLAVLSVSVSAKLIIRLPSDFNAKFVANIQRATGSFTAEDKAEGVPCISNTTTNAQHFSGISLLCTTGKFLFEVLKYIFPLVLMIYLERPITIVVLWAWANMQRQEELVDLGQFVGVGELEIEGDEEYYGEGEEYYGEGEEYYEEGEGYYEEGEEYYEEGEELYYEEEQDEEMEEAEIENETSTYPNPTYPFSLSSTFLPPTFNESPLPSSYLPSRFYPEPLPETSLPPPSTQPERRNVISLERYEFIGGRLQKIGVPLECPKVVTPSVFSRTYGPAINRGFSHATRLTSVL